jgi:hypothetical protein
MLGLAALTIAALVAAATTNASSTRTKVLTGWSGGSQSVGMSSVRFHGPLVRQLAPGTYRLRIRAEGVMPFRLRGPGVDRTTRFDERYSSVYATWTLRLRPGTYRYACVGHWADALRANGITTQRSFVVR